MLLLLELTSGQMNSDPQAPARQCASVGMGPPTTLEKIMIITDDDLQDLIDSQADYVTSIQMEAPDEDDPVGFALHVESEEQIFSALVELSAWRASHPDERMEPAYITPYGIVGEQ